MIALTRAWSRTIVAFVGCLAVVVLGGCSSGPKSTAMTDSDVDAMTAEMKPKLLNSAFLRERRPDSPPAVIAIQKPQNLTRHIFPESEQWMIINRVRRAAPIQDLRREKAIVFVIPSQFIAEGVERGAYADQAFQERAPTHVMTATFNSASREFGKDRTDAYLMLFSITELGSGKLAWEDTFELKRIAVGRVGD